MERVYEVIKGFETPYGMELLATVHWILKSNQPSAVEDIIGEVQQWNNRKKELFPPRHIIKAAQHLKNVRING